MSRFYLFESALTLDTSIYADGDVLSDLLTVTGGVRRAGLYGKVVSLQVIDKDDQGAAFDVFFFDRSITAGTKNAAWAVSDSDMAYCLGKIAVGGSDYQDLGGNRVALPSVREFVVKANSGTSLYVATMSRGTGTYTASGLLLKIGIEQD